MGRRLLGVAGLIAAPILVYFALHPDHFFIRSNQLLILQPDQSQGDPLGALLGNVWEHLLAFGFGGDPNWRHNFAGHPMLNPLEAFFFWFGAGMAVWRWQRPAYRLLLLWLAGPAPAGHPGQGYSRPQHAAHDRRGAGYLSAGGYRRVGGVPILEETVFSGK